MCQSERYWPPLVAGGAVYYNAGQFGGMDARFIADGRFLFSATLPQHDQWSPLYLRGRIYSFQGGLLKGCDAPTGAATSTAGSTTGADVISATTAVSDGERVYVVSTPTLLAYKPGELNPTWSVKSAYGPEPAVANGVLYAV